MIFILTLLSFSQSKVFKCPVTIFQNPVKIRYEMEKDFIFQPCFFINIQQHNFPSLVNTLKHIFQSCKLWLEYIFLTMYLYLPLRVKYFVFSSFDVEISAFLLFSFKLCIPFNWCEEISTSIQLKFPVLFIQGEIFLSFLFSQVEIFLSIQLQVNTEYSVSIQSKFLALYIPAHHQCLMFRYLFSSASCVSTELISFTTMLFEFIIEGLYLSEDWEADRRLIAVGVHMSDIELMLSNRFSEEIELMFSMNSSMIGGGGCWGGGGGWGSFLSVELVTWLHPGDISICVG